MEHVEYKIEIAATAKKVWNTMLEDATYRQWAGKGWPDSFYQGKWIQGEKIRFIGADGSGTLAEIRDLKPHRHILVRHVAILEKGGNEDTTSEMAKGWIGISEAYNFNDHNGRTTLTIAIQTRPEWKQMFDDGWPAALEELKRLSEK